MKGRKPFLSLAVAILTCAILAGCAGSVPQNGPAALNISHAPLKAGVIGIAYKQLLVASGGLTPYTWSISDGQLPPGLSLSSDGVISGSPTQTGKFTFTAKVVDSQTPVQALNSWTTSITVNEVLALDSATLVTGLAGGPYSATITALNGLPPYHYTLIDGSLPDGLELKNDSNDNSATISGTPTTAGVYTFTIQATDSYSEAATGQFTLTVVGRLQGPYVLSLNGFDNGQPVYLVANIVADGNGNITGGALDQVGPGSNTVTNEAIKGTYSIGTNSNFGSLTLTDTGGQTLFNFHILVSTAGDSRAIWSDQNAPNSYGSGLIKKQAIQVLPGGATSYSFGLFGNGASGERYAAAGMFSVGSSNSNVQPVTGGEQDVNDNGTVTPQISITGGSLDQADSTTGRGTLSLTTASGTANYVYYVVSATELLAVDVDATGPQVMLDLQQQQVLGASGFTNASLKGQGVIQLNGVDTSGGSTAPTAAVGVATFDGSGNIARSDDVKPYYLDQNVGGNVSTVQYDSGTYNVDPTCGTIQSPCGRVTVNLAGASTQPVWYLVNTNQAFIVDTDAAATSGVMQSQTVPSQGFALLNLLGSYLGNTQTPTLSTITNQLDVALTPPPGGIWSLTFDSSGPAGPHDQGSFHGNYDCGGTPPGCSTIGTALGRFEITNSNDNQAQSIIYVIGSGSTGTTGSKGGLVELNVGLVSRDGTTIPDPNPRLSGYSR